MKASEANLLSFHILFDTKGRLVTETSGLPIHEAKQLFKGAEGGINPSLNVLAYLFTKLNNYLKVQT